MVSKKIRDLVSTAISRAESEINLEARCRKFIDVRQRICLSASFTIARVRKTKKRKIGPRTKVYNAVQGLSNSVRWTLSSYFGGERGEGESLSSPLRRVTLRDVGEIHPWKFSRQRGVGKKVLLEVYDLLVRAGVKPKFDTWLNTIR